MAAWQGCCFFGFFERRLASGIDNKTEWSLCQGSIWSYMNKNNASMGERLRELRGEMTQREFGELLGIGTKTVSRYESNERSPDAELIIKLNVLFGADPLWFLSGKEPGTGGVTLTAKEQQLLKGYRQLDNERRAAIEGMVQALVNQGK